jgi:hypothetical protein
VAFSVSGLEGDLSLTNNGADALTVSADGTYAFPAQVTHGTAYNVTVASEPVDRACTVSAGAGSATGAITGIQVQCVPVDPLMPRAVTITATAPKMLRVEWQSVPDATYYRLLRDNDSVPGGALIQLGSNTTQTSALDYVSVHLRTGYIYVVEACDAMRCVASAPVSTDGMLKNAVGYFKADWRYTSGYLGVATALSSDGKILAAGSGSLGTYVFRRLHPVWQQQARIALNPKGTSDPLGRAIALSADGNTLAVLETYGRGRVRIFTRDGWSWTQQAMVSAPGTTGQNFGNSLSISGDGNTLVAGDPAGFSLSGRAYVFERQGTVWSASAVLAASNSYAQGGFGHSVAIAADASTLVVGAPGEDGVGTGVNGSQTLSGNLASNSGAVYVFGRSGSTWVQQAYLKPGTTAQPSLFGNAVSLSANGNVLAVGANADANAGTGINPAYSHLTLPSSGAVYLFERVHAAWTQQAYLKAFTTDAYDEFGFSVSLSGNGSTLAVGAPEEDSAGTDLELGMSSDDSLEGSGAAYVFTRSATTWRQVRYIKAPVATGNPYYTGVARTYFGRSVALSADAATLAVGSYAESGYATGINGPQGSISAYQTGAVYLY